MMSQLVSPSPQTAPGVVAGMPKTIRVGVLSPINKLDPRDAVDYVSAIVLSQIFEAPYAAAEGSAAAKPLLFETLRREDSTGLHYSAAIRPGICFSDGTPLTAEIAVRSLRGAAVLRNKAAVEVRNGRVWFTLTAPNPRFDLTLTQSSCAIVHDKGLQLLGTGPFMFEQRPNLRILQTAPVLKLTRNPSYHAKSDAQEIHFAILPAEADGSPQKLVEALRSGSIDLTTSLSAADLVNHRVTGMTATTHPASSTAMLFVNSERRLLASREVRNGIAGSLDLHAIAAAAYDRNPAAFVAAGVLPPSMGRSSTFARPDRQNAARLLEAGGAKGAKLTMVVPWAPRPYLPKPMNVALVIQKQLEAAGLSVSLVETKTSDAFFEALYSGRFDLALAGWIADTPDPADFLEALLWSRTIGGENHSNYGRWKHDPTDAALARYRAMPSDESRADVDRIIAEETPLIPLMYGQSSVVHSRKLRNVAIASTGLLPLSEVAVGI
jgi:ABC-type transport system substrate-binding protein